MSNKQGFFFQIELENGFIRFKLLGFILWAKINLADADYFRVSSKSEHYDCVRRGESVLFWPVAIWGYKRRTAPLYVLKDRRKGRKIFFRARSGYHYKIRTAIGHARNHDAGDAPSPW